MCNWSTVSRHSVGRYMGSLLSTQPSVGVSSPTGDSLLPALDTSKAPTLHFLYQISSMRVPHH